MTEQLSTHTPRLHYYFGESRVRPNYFDLEFFALFYDGSPLHKEEFYSESAFVKVQFFC